jgi:hypothetical protein
MVFRNLLPIVLILAFSSCMSVPFSQPKLPQEGFSVEDLYQDGAISFEAKLMGFNWKRVEDSSVGYGYRLDLGYSGVDLVIRNKTTSPVTIVWARCSIDSPGSGSSSLFLTGQRFVDVGRDNPNQIIRAGSYLRRGIYPAANVQYARDWVIEDISSDELSLLMCVEVEGSERFYVIKCWLVR